MQRTRREQGKKEELNTRAQCDAEHEKLTRSLWTCRWAMSRFRKRRPVRLFDESVARVARVRPRRDAKSTSRVGSERKRMAGKMSIMSIMPKGGGKSRGPARPTSDVIKPIRNRQPPSLPFLTCLFIYHASFIFGTCHHPARLNPVAISLDRTAHCAPPPEPPARLTPDT